MKKRIAILSAFILLIATLVFGADYKKDIVGKWSYDYKGQQAKVEHKADGTFNLAMGDVKVNGTYTVKGDKIGRAHV